MAEMKDVKLWAINRGIGHIVASTRNYWVHTLCNRMSPCFEQTKDVPKRKCRECMAALKEAK